MKNLRITRLHCIFVTNTSNLIFVDGNKRVKCEDIDNLQIIPKDCNNAILNLNANV